jgi:hypothetical protein
MLLLNVGNADVTSNQIQVRLEKQVLFGWQHKKRTTFSAYETNVYFGPLVLWVRGEVGLDASSRALELQELLDALRCPECLCTAEMTPDGMHCPDCGWSSSITDNPNHDEYEEE